MAAKGLYTAAESRARVVRCERPMAAALVAHQEPSSCIGCVSTQTEELAMAEGQGERGCGDCRVSERARA